MKIHNTDVELWKVIVVDTVYIRCRWTIKACERVCRDENFMLTYGGDVCDVNIKDLVTYQKSPDKLVILTAIQPRSGFGTLVFGDDNLVEIFAEKSNYF